MTDLALSASPSTPHAPNPNLAEKSRDCQRAMSARARRHGRGWQGTDGRADGAARARTVPRPGSRRRRRAIRCPARPGGSRPYRLASAARGHQPYGYFCKKNSPLRQPADRPPSVVLPRSCLPSDLVVLRFNQRTGETAIVRNWMRSNLLHLRRSRRDDAVGLRLGWQQDDSIPIVFMERPDQNESAACDPTRPAARTRLKMAGDHRWSEGVWLDRHRCRPGPAIARRVWRRADGCKIPARSE